jgi:predicted nucleic acid-binding protein
VKKRVLRIYLDTSVFGGYFDEKFELASRRLFSRVRKGEFVVVMSDVVTAELANAPEEVRQLANSIVDSSSGQKSGLRQSNYRKLTLQQGLSRKSL